MAEAPKARLQSGIAGLDEVLGGGLIHGDTYLVIGEPGAGKTTLGNQLAYNLARGGGSTIFATVLAETHDRMLTHLRSFEFYDPQQVGDRLYYVSLFETFAQDGLSAGLDVLRRTVRERKANLLVVDGASVLEELAATELDLRRFVYALQAQLGMLGCTTMLLLNHSGQSPHGLATYVDGIVLLENRPNGVRDQRTVRVAKLRGSNHRSGRHDMAITSSGIVVSPRLESGDVPERTSSSRDGKRLGFGVPGIDDMLRGGFLPGSTTLMMGTPGAGKTLTGLHFLMEGARLGESGLIATFHESVHELASKGAGVGLEIGHYLESGLLSARWQPATEQSADAWAHELLRLVDERKPKRVVIESLVEIERLLEITPQRLAPFLTALLGQLAAAGATTLITAELSSLVGQDVEIPTLTGAIDNAILLRYVELRSQLHRLLSIIKIRNCDYDTAIREFQITDEGLDVASTFESAEAVLTGAARLTPPPTRGSLDDK